MKVASRVVSMVEQMVDSMVVLKVDSTVYMLAVTKAACLAVKTVVLSADSMAV